MAAVTGSVAISSPALAQTPCTAADLISAISAANSTNGTVTLSSGCAYTLTAINNTTDGGGVGLPVITGKVTIIGSGATIARSSASGTPAFRIFDVASSGSLTLNTTTVGNGLANNGQQGGGGIFNNGTLTITGSVFTSNSAPATTGTSGGAINNNGTLNLSTSTFTGNSAQEGGGVFNQATATITSDTFSGNSAFTFGGGALINAAGTMTVTGATFAGNTGPGGGAIDNDTTLNISDSTFNANTGGTNGGGAIVNFGPATVTQTTIAGNSSPYGANLLNYTGVTLKLSMSIVAYGQGGGPNCGGGQPVTDSGYNIDTGSTCGFTTASHSMSNTDPQVGPLASNGGPTQTMALPPSGSPAVDSIPGSATGCTGTTDQRGVIRPQGTGCDIGAYELAQSGSGTPSVPTGLTVTSTKSNSVSLSWNASAGNPTGYTVYRDGNSVGTTGGSNATTYTDTTVSPSTTYSYTVDAFSGGNHSAQSSPVQATTLAPGSPTAVQGGSVSTSSQVTSATITLSAPVHAGDLLVGWFGQYNSSGQVHVSDSVNGAWTRSSASTTFSSGSGDIALYYIQNSAAAPSGLTITISAPAATYLQGSVGEYSGLATAGAIDQVSVARGNSTTVDAGPTAPTGAGEVVIGGIITGGSPGTVTAGSSQGQNFTWLTQSASQSANQEDIVSSAAGPQDARATFSTATDWYAVVATFHPFGSGNTSPPSAHWVQGGAVSTGTQVSSVTIKLTSPVGAGDLLVGWFGQYNSSGQVTVSDNVNGAWTRGSASTTFGSGSGDIALYYLQNSAASASGLTITITATSATYLEAAAADYSGVATANALDQMAVAKGNSTTPDSGPTVSVSAGELVVGAMLTGGSPGTVTAGSSQGQAFTMRSGTGSGSADIEDILVSAAGAQDGRATFSSATDWYAVAAVFRHA